MPNREGKASNRIMRIEFVSLFVRGKGAFLKMLKPIESKIRPSTDPDTDDQASFAMRARFFSYSGVGEEGDIL